MLIYYSYRFCCSSFPLAAKLAKLEAHNSTSLIHDTNDISGTRYVDYLRLYIDFPLAPKLLQRLAAETIIFFYEKKSVVNRFAAQLEIAERRL